MVSEKPSILDSILRYPASVIDRIENSSVPFHHFIIMFIVYVMARNLVEIFWIGEKILLLSHVHFTLFWIFTVLVLILITRLVSGCDVLNCFRVVSTFMFLILVGPVIDMVLSGDRTAAGFYIFADNPGELLAGFVRFLGGYEAQVVTAGQRLYVFLILVLLFVYVLIKTEQKLLRSLVTLFLVYAALYLILALPSIFSMLGYVFEDEQCIRLYFIGSAALLLVLFYLSNKLFFLTILKDIRPVRTLHYLLMLGFGAVLACNMYYSVPHYALWNFVILSVCTVFAIVFTTITDNFADIQTDRVIHPERPMFKKNISAENYQLLSCVSLLIAFTGSFLTGYVHFLLLSAFVSVHYLYSMPPIRFKRFPVLSKLRFSLGSLLLAVCGFAVFAHNTTYLLRIFPLSIIFFFVFLFTVAANFMDIKNHERDKSLGFRTLPVVIGLKKAKVVTGIFVVLGYFFIGYLFYQLAPYCAGLAVVQFYLINRKRYSEKPVLAIYFLSLAVLIYLIYAEYIWI